MHRSVIIIWISNDTGLVQLSFGASCQIFCINVVQLGLTQICIQFQMVDILDTNLHFALAIVVEKPLD